MAVCAQAVRRGGGASADAAGFARDLWASLCSQTHPAAPNEAEEEELWQWLLHGDAAALPSYSETFYRHVNSQRDPHLVFAVGDQVSSLDND